jgi:hypothetical protein
MTPRPEMFAIERLDNVLQRVKRVPDRTDLPEDGVVVSARRLIALLNVLYEESSGPTETVVSEAIDALHALYPDAPARAYIRAPEGACDLLVVEEESSSCVGCGWDAEDHDPEVQEHARREAIEAEARDGSST